MRQLTLILIAATGALIAGSLLLHTIDPAHNAVASPVASATTTSSFRALDISINAHDEPLAAYQFEVWADGADVKLVGIEGGESEAFKEPPHYDPRALTLPTPRVIVAAFNAGTDLPKGKTRVARLMIHVGGDALPNYHTNLQVAASVDGKTIANATIILAEGAKP